MTKATGIRRLAIKISSLDEAAILSLIDLLRQLCSMTSADGITDLQYLKGNNDKSAYGGLERPCRG